MMTQVSMATNATPHRLPPLIYPKSVFPARDTTGLHESGARRSLETPGDPEGLGVKDRQVKAARKRELARRHLSNSLQGIRTTLPDLRRTQSFNVPVLNGVRDDPGKAAGLKRKPNSLGPRKSLHDHDLGEGVRRTHSWREAGSSKESSPQPLSLSVPQPQGVSISLATLVHELNTSMHHSFPSRRPSSDLSLNENDDDTIEELFNYENGLDPDLCLSRLTGQDSSEMVDRTLTPTLRKLNRRRVSSRVRTQQWVNQIEGEQRRAELRNRVTEAQNPEMARVSLLYEQET